MKRLGMIGGMGPLATIDLFSKIVALTDATKDQEHIPIIIDNYPQIEDRTGHILRGEPSPEAKIVESAKRLQSAGVDALIMPCNTAHYFANAINNAVNIPLIHIVDCTVEAIKRDYPNAKRIAVAASSGTKAGKVYENILLQQGFEVVEISDDIDEALMDCIYKGVKAGKSQEFAHRYQYAVDKIEELGADVIIAGCTELPILREYITTDMAIVDATLELAKAAVKFAKS